MDIIFFPTTESKSIARKETNDASIISIWMLISPKLPTMGTPRKWELGINHQLERNEIKYNNEIRTSLYRHCINHSDIETFIYNKFVNKQYFRVSTFFYGK